MKTVQDAPRFHRKYKPLQMSIPNAAVPARIAAKIGIIGALRINPRRTAASGTAKSIASAGRQSWVRLEVVSL